MPPSGYESRELTGPAEIAAAKRLQGTAYVRHRHVLAEALTPEGWLPWHDHVDAARVRWFGAVDADGKVAAVGRRIAADRSGLASLPAVRLMAAAVPEAVRSCPPDRVVELSGLAKTPHAALCATLHVYRALYRDSLRSGSAFWVMSVVPALRATLERVLPGALTFGPRAVRLANAHAGVRPEVVALPAWGAVEGMPARIRAAADAAADSDTRAFLHRTAAFLAE